MFHTNLTGSLKVKSLFVFSCVFLCSIAVFWMLLIYSLSVCLRFHGFCVLSALSGTSCRRRRNTTICLTWWRACWSTSLPSVCPWLPPCDTRSLPLCPPVTKPPPRAGRAAGTSADDACLPHLRLHPTHTPACVQELKVELGIVFSWWMFLKGQTEEDVKMLGGLP